MIIVRYQGKEYCIPNAGMSRYVDPRPYHRGLVKLYHIDYINDPEYWGDCPVLAPPDEVRVIRRQHPQPDGDFSRNHDLEMLGIAILGIRC